MYLYLLTNKNKVLPLITIIIILLSIGFLRYHDIAKQFGHGDDLVVPVLVLDAMDLNREGNVGSDYFNRSLSKIVPEEYIDLIKKVAINLYPYVSVPSSQNYAAGQYFIYPLILNETQSYEDKKLFSRIPSFIFSMLALLCLAIGSSILDLKNSNWFRVIPLLILACSLESHIYSRFSMPYSAGVFSASMLLLSFILFYKKKINEFILSVILSISLILNYQSWVSIPVISVIVLYLLFCRYTSKINIMIGALKVSILPILTIIISFIVFLKHKKFTAITYNSGVNNEYLYNYQINSILDLYNLLNKFINNLFMDVWLMFLPLSFNDIVNKTSSIIIFILLIGGITLMFKSSGLLRLISIIAALFLMQIIILGLVNVFPMGPTRHFLYYAPFFSIPISYVLYCVVNQISKFLKNIIYVHIFSVIALASYFIFSVFSFVNYNLSGMDPFNQKYIDEIVNDVMPDSVVSGDCSFQFRLANYIYLKTPIFYSCGGQIRWQGLINLESKPNKILYISYAEPLNKEWISVFFNSANIKIKNEYFNSDINKWKINILTNSHGDYALEALNYTDHIYGRNDIYISIIDLVK